MDKLTPETLRKLADKAYTDGDVVKARDGMYAHADAWAADIDKGKLVTHGWGTAMAEIGKLKESLEAAERWRDDTEQLLRDILPTVRYGLADGIRAALAAQEKSDG